MPSWFERRKDSQGLGLSGVTQARGSEQFRVNRFRQQYFLSKFDLKARGYERITLINGCSCVIEGSFDGFMSVNHCTIKIIEPKPSDGGPRPAPEFVVVTCMIPPDRRVSLGVDVEGQSRFTSYFVEFWRSRDAGAIGSSNFNPDALLMKVNNFANATEANIVATRMLLSNIAVTLPPINSEKKDRNGWFIDTRIPGENTVECASLKITGGQDRDFFYPIMMKRGMEKILRLVAEEDTSENG
ncbi:hypothetical protein [Endozoicomonas euniceicola]|uniref:Uncharacterized protein n=1 Tax=Endozoicomonas euniceicola TaxID=1234143 RepID=A0ABY6GUQ3_9GAMM|nr:hypothetical protein [Endozoicomonas euniceicola]UYM16508.1 hypothetical protein NX720_00805 [Endozoicomonas euniceicola]